MTSVPSLLTSCWSEHKAISCAVNSGSWIDRVVYVLHPSPQTYRREAMMTWMFNKVKLDGLPHLARFLCSVSTLSHCTTYGLQVCTAIIQWSGSLFIKLFMSIQPCFLGEGIDVRIVHGKGGLQGRVWETIFVTWIQKWEEQDPPSEQQQKCNIKF